MEIKYQRSQKDSVSISPDKADQANVNTTKEERLVLILGNSILY